jgi:aspartate racemase
VKHTGIVACSAEGAALCYQTICREALTLVGKNDHPRITLDSIAMARWLPAFDAGDYAGVAGFMLDSARLLAAAGADFAICPDNSAHLAWDHVRQRRRSVAAHRAGGGRRRPAAASGRWAFSARATMAGPVYSESLGALGIETVVPEAADFETVDRIIFAELVDGVFTDASRRAYNRIIAASPSAAATPSPWPARSPFSSAPGITLPTSTRRDGSDPKAVIEALK